MKTLTKSYLTHVIIPVVDALGFDKGSPRFDIEGFEVCPADALLLGTALAESGLRNLEQVGGGPAIGYFQMEPATHDDIWEHWLKSKSSYRTAMENICRLGLLHPPSTAMIWNLRYAACMARFHYRRQPGKMEDLKTVEDLANYWKSFYNTPSGKGTVEHFVKTWEDGM